MKQILTKFKYGIYWSKPYYPLRIIRNLILGKTYALLGMKKFMLRGIGIQIIYACNFNCSHCSCKKLIEPNRELMTVDDYKRLCEQAMELGCTTFGIEGGEPFMRKDWREVIKAFKPKYNHTMITTNSSFLTDKLVKELKDMGVDTLNLSLDSGFPKEHDEFRNCTGNFEQVINAIKLCEKYKIRVVFNMVLWKGNLYSKGFVRLLNLADKHNIFINTMFAKATGNFSESKESMLDEEDIEYYYNVRKTYPQILRHLDYNFGSWGCPGAKEMLNITPYGDVFICANCHISGGNLKRESLKIIRDRMLEKDYFNRYQKCLLSENKEFMDKFYPMMENRLKPLQLEEFG